MKKYDKYPDSVFYEKDNKILFEEDYENNNLYVDYNNIYRILEIIFHMKYKNIDDLIKKCLKDIINVDLFIEQNYLNPKDYLFNGV